MQSVLAEPSAARSMPTPHEVLAEELGLFAVAVRRELREARDLALSEIRAEMASLRQQASDLRLIVAGLEQQAKERIALLRDGKDADPVDYAEIERMVAEAAAKLPAPKDGKDADPDEIAAMIAEQVADRVAKLPVPKDGKDADPDEIASMVASAVERAVASIRVPRDGNDGIGISAAKMVDGELVLTFTDGTEQNVGRVVGKDGEDGKHGKLPLCKVWTDEVHYANQVVVYRGALFQAVRDTGREPGTDDWICLAERGKDGGSPAVRGTYDPEGVYCHLDIVALDGGSFIAKRDKPGPCPGDGWQLLVTRGKPGKPGEPGKKGDPSKIPGPPGAVIVGWKNDVRGYLAIPVMSDGEEGPPLNIRAYLEQFLAETQS